MKKLKMLVLFVLVCGMGYQQMWAAKWVVVNAMAACKCAYAVVITHDNNQDIISLINPGDTGVYNSAPTNIMVYSMVDGSQLYNDRKPLTDPSKAALIVINASQDGREIYTDTMYTGTHIGGQLFLVNAAPYKATYHVGYTTAVCSNDDGSLDTGRTAILDTELCLTDNLHAWFNIGGTQVYTPKYQGRTNSGVFVFREHPSKPGTFQYTGPWN